MITGHGQKACDVNKGMTRSRCLVLFVVLCATDEPWASDGFHRV